MGLGNHHIWPTPGCVQLSRQGRPKGFICSLSWSRTDCSPLVPVNPLPGAWGHLTSLSLACSPDEQVHLVGYPRPECWKPPLGARSPMKHLRGQRSVAGGDVPVLQVGMLRLQELRELGQHCIVFRFPFLFHITPTTERELGRTIRLGVHMR